MKVPKFSQRHYEFLARTLRPFNNCAEKLGILEDLCDAFEADNPRFTRDKFWDAATQESAAPDWICKQCGKPAETRWNRETCFKCGMARPSWARI